jgi:hypothetical protein
MTLPGGDPGEKPREQIGEDLPSGAQETPPAEQASPAHDHPPTQGPPAQDTAAPDAHPPPSGFPQPPQYGPPPGQYGPPPVHGYGPSYPPPAYPGQDQFGYGYAPPQQTTTNTMAIASLVTSVLGIVPFCGGILSIVGIALGTVALSQIKETRQEGYGIAVAGIVVGVAMLIVGLIWTIFALR